MLITEEAGKQTDRNNNTAEIANYTTTSRLYKTQLQQYNNNTATFVETNNSCLHI